MSQRTAKIIAIIAVVALIGTLAVGLVVGGTGDPAGNQGDAGTTQQFGPQASPGATTVLGGPHLFVVLCDGVACPRPDEDEEARILADIAADPRVRDARLITAERWYEAFLEQYGDQEELVDALDPDTIPAQVQVYLRNPLQVETVMAEVAALDGVDDVIVTPSDEDA